MDGNIIDLQQARIEKKAAVDGEMLDYFINRPPTLTSAQCAQARAMLDWSQEALAFRSGASVKAIDRFESGLREVRDVTRQALAFALEAEGLLFFPGHEPMTGSNCRGSTADPRTRSDFHLIE